MAHLQLIHCVIFMCLLLDGHATGVSTAFRFSVPVMPAKNTGAGKSAKNNNKGVRGPPHYATNPTGTIKTRNQDTRDALSAVMSQLHEKSGKKFLPDTAPDDGASAPPEEDAKPLPPPSSPPSDGSDKSDDSLGLDKEVSHSLTGSRRPDVADSVTKRRSQNGSRRH